MPSDPVVHEQFASPAWLWEGFWRSSPVGLLALSNGRLSFHRADGENGFDVAVSEIAQASTKRFIVFRVGDRDYKFVFNPPQGAEPFERHKFTGDKVDTLTGLLEVGLPIAPGLHTVRTLRAVPGQMHARKVWTEIIEQWGL